MQINAQAPPPRSGAAPDEAPLPGDIHDGPEGSDGVTRGLFDAARGALLGGAIGAGSFALSMSGYPTRPSNTGEVVMQGLIAGTTIGALAGGLLGTLKRPS